MPQLCLRSTGVEIIRLQSVVTDRVHEAHQNRSAPMMMLFPALVVTVILRYPYQRFSPTWDSITGVIEYFLSRFKMTVRHVVLLLCQFVNHMEVIDLPIYYPSLQEKDDPKQYANNVRRLMATEGGKQPLKGDCRSNKDFCRMDTEDRQPKAHLSLFFSLSYG
ncbi:peroxisomal membrane protein 11A-like [Hibiscus syriacus]|uniref:Peroxisomal membrane protein 11A-like n=1 Tax=Hibiscus syriacus TaxID=106335 RepID=A0A6A2XFI8_HIBSY|nr:peroxisomal membrane protein 11A-like [Hibiscus syriacus]